MHITPLEHSIARTAWFVGGVDAAHVEVVDAVNVDTSLTGKSEASRTKYCGDCVNMHITPSTHFVTLTA